MPPGVHDASLEEIRRLFGQFQQTDRRPKLFAKLEELVAQLGNQDFVKFLLVNGFVTADQFHDYLVDSFEQLYHVMDERARELERRPVYR